MHKPFHSRIILIGLLNVILAFIFHIESFAQSDSTDRQEYIVPEFIPPPINYDSFDREDWKKIIEGIDYKEYKKNENELKLPDPNVARLKALIFKVLFLLSLVTVVGFLIYKLRKYKDYASKKNLKIPDVDIIPEWESLKDNIENTDMEKLFHKAKNSMQLNLALRIKYLEILKQLGKAKIISLHKSKTNANYIKELAGTSLHSRFIHLTKIFEQSWYGDQIIDEKQFSKLLTEFIDFEKEIIGN